MDRFRMLPNYRYYESADGIITTDYERPLRDYRIYGNSVQDGTPSPDNPVEIQSVGEETKNLFDINNIETTTTGITNNGDGSITVSGYPSSTLKFLYELCPSMKIGQTITFSMITNGYHQIYLTNTASGVKTYLTNNKSFVVTEDILNSKVSFYSQSSAQGGGDVIISNIQFEEGTEVTPFEPYGKYKIPVEVSNENHEVEIYNIFLDEPLRKCGDYADYIDFKNKKLIKQTRYYESIYDAINNKSSDGRWGWGVATAYKKTWGTMAIEGTYSVPMSSHFLGLITGVPSYAMDAHIQKSAQNNAIYGAFPYIFFEEFKGLEADTFPNLEVSERSAIIDEWMIANKVDYQVSIKTPIEEDIELPEIKLHKGTNIIKVQTTTQPSQANWQYYK